MTGTRLIGSDRVDQMKRLVSLFVVTTILLAACGGGDGSSGSATVDDWCALAQRLEDTGSDYEVSLESGGETLADAFEQFAALLDDAQRVAPDEIKDAVETSAEGITTFRELLEGVDYDLFALDESAFAELEAMSEEMDSATERIDAYNQRECGIDGESLDGESLGAAPEPQLSDSTESDSTTDSDSAAEADSAAGSGPASDPTSTWCVAAQAIENAGNPFDDVDFTDPLAVEAAVTEMVGLFQAAATVAPPELADDVAISLQFIEGLAAALEDADWDLLTADLSMLEEDAESEAAEANIEAYNEAACGIANVDQPDEDPSSFDPLGGTVRDQAIAELVATGFTDAEATCVFDNLDFTDPEASADPAVIMGVFEACEIDLDRLAELGG